MSGDVYSHRVAQALQPYGQRQSGAKVLAGIADATERAARNWLTGICGPQASVLIRLMAREPAVAAAVADMVEEQRRLDADLAARRARRGPGR